MKMSGKIIGTILITICASALGFAQEKTPKTGNQDDAALRQIVKDVETGWNAHDGKAFAAPFAPDADYVVVNGMHVKGRRENASAHQQIFDTFYKGTKLWVRVKSVRVLKPDVMLIHSVSKVLKPGESDASPEPEAIQTWMVSKHGSEWLVDAFHNTPIQRQGGQDSKP